MSDQEEKRICFELDVQNVKKKRQKNGIFRTLTTYHRHLIKGNKIDDFGSENHGFMKKKNWYEIGSTENWVTRPKSAHPSLPSKQSFVGNKKPNNNNSPFSLPNSLISGLENNTDTVNLKKKVDKNSSKNFLSGNFLRNTPLLLNNLKKYRHDQITKKKELKQQQVHWFRLYQKGLVSVLEYETKMKELKLKMAEIQPTFIE